MPQNRISKGAAFLLCVIENETQYFIWHNGNMVYEFTSTDDNSYTYGLRLISSDDNIYVLNAHGDVVALLDASGNVTKRYEYDAFGEEIGIDENDSNPFRYCGEYFDKQSGTIYLRARYYNPTIGRFSTVDPIRDGLNWNAYCYNDPISYIDPTGCVVTEWDLEHLSPEDVAKLARFTIEYEEAQALGDTAAMTNAHEKAVSVRKPYLNIVKVFLTTEM